MTEGIDSQATKVVVNGQALKAAAGLLDYVVPRSTPKPVLSCVYLEALHKEAKLRLRATDLEVTLELTMPVVVRQAGEKAPKVLLVPARRLVAALGRADGPIELVFRGPDKPKEVGFLSIGPAEDVSESKALLKLSKPRKGSKAKAGATLESLDPGDYPSPVQLSDDAAGGVVHTGTASLLRAFEVVKDFCADVGTRYALNRIAFYPGEIRLVATEGHVIATSRIEEAVATMPEDEAKETVKLLEKPYLVPPSAFSLLARLAPRKGKVVSAFGGDSCEVSCFRPELANGRKKLRGEEVKENQVPEMSPAAWDYVRFETSGEFGEAVLLVGCSPVGGFPDWKPFIPDKPESLEASAYRWGLEVEPTKEAVELIVKQMRAAEADTFYVDVSFSDGELFLSREVKSYPGDSKVWASMPAVEMKGGKVASGFNAAFLQSIFSALAKAGREKVEVLGPEEPERKPWVIVAGADIIYVVMPMERVD